MTHNKGFGKVILFGEHFVVYNLPGIASGISDYTTAAIRKGTKGFEFIDNRPETPGYKEIKKDEIKRQLDALLKYFEVDAGKSPIRITLGGNLTCASGVGASAALATSIVRAFNEKLKLGLNDNQINQAAYIAEEAGSGKPSGIDNTCSVFGGFITFEKNPAGGPNKIEKLKVRPVEIVMGNTGISQETKLVVEDVRRKKEADPAWFDRICKGYLEVFRKAVVAASTSDWKAVGRLMDENQKLLRQIGVSCGELEQLIKIAKDNGAWGAKLTGTGRGGYMVALTPGKELQKNVAKAMEDAGFSVLKTTIGGWSEEKTEQTIFLVRHGETDWNVEDRIQGRIQHVQLNSKGISQSKLLAKRLGNEKIGVIFSSPQERALQTAEIIAEPAGLAIITHIGLAEREHGVFDGMTRDEIRKAHPEVWKVYERTRELPGVEGAETMKQMEERAVMTFMEIARKGQNKNMVIVSHGGVCKMIISRLTGKDRSEFHQHNCCLNIIKFDGKNFIAEKIDDKSHLKMDYSVPKK